MLIKKFCSLNVKGKGFIEEKTIPILNKDERVSIIYGKNGSGKSSICDAIKATLEENTRNQYEILKLCDYDENELMIKGNEKIYVYNENFIDENIKLNAKGMKSIIMFGEQKKLDDIINEKNNIRKVAQEEKEVKEKQYEKYEDKNNLLSPQYYMQKIETTLKSEDGWAERDREIKGNKQKSQVKEDTIKNILSKRIDNSEKQKIKEEYNDKLKIFLKIDSTSLKIEEEIKTIICEEKLDDEIRNMLSKKIEKTKLTEREKVILKSIENGMQLFYEDVRKQFTSEKIDICPYCFQKVSEEQKGKVINSINSVLNKEVDNYKEELEKIELPEVEPIDIIFKELDENLYLNINKKITEYIEYKKEIENMILEKIKNIYIPQFIYKIELKNRIDEINKLLKEMEKERKEYNLSINNRIEIKKELIELNYNVAWNEIKEDYLNYEKQLIEMNKLKEEINKYTEKIKNLEKEIRELENQKSNKIIALNKINEWLRYILYSKDRLTIEYYKDEYYVKVRGRDVKLEDLSVGERNIISLCYFFSTMLDNMNEVDEFCSEYLILIDDPISSFDFENKIGLYTFFRYIFSKILTCNKDSKIICLTHSLEVIFNLEKVISDINKQGISYKYSIKELNKFEIKDFRFGNRNEYACMLRSIYDFARNAEENDELEDKIGNIMRRVLEAFATFNYKKNIEELSIDKEILSKVPEDRQEYFQNSMYRIVLNQESHSYDRARNMPDTDFFQYISIEEKIRTAKDILVFLYLLDKIHIKKHIPESISTIEEWNRELDM